MSGKILVAYATRHGSTEGVAKAIGDALADAGAAVEVRPAGEVEGLGGYDAVVLGSGVRAGRLFRDAVRLARRNREALKRMPVAYFLVCITMYEDTEANRRKVERWLEPLTRIAEPVETGLFAGAIDRDKLGCLFGVLLWLVRAPKGDFREWDKIKTWATGLRPKLLRG